MSKVGNKRKNDNEKHLQNLISGSLQGKSKISTLYEDIEKEFDKTVINISIDSLFPAPSDWNFFPEISDSKMLEMMFSIQENGLFNPIIVWKQKDKYMILSGHNRVNAYKRIAAEYQGSKNFNEEEYKTIPAIVYDDNEIDETKAREIIIDTNYIQREEDKRLMPEIVKNRIELVKNRKDMKGRTIDIVARELGISSTKAYEDQLIANKIIPELSELYFQGKIKKKPLLKFAWFDKSLQRKLYKEVKPENIDNDSVLRIRKSMSLEELVKVFTDKDFEKRVVVQVRVPESLKDEFREMAKQWITENSPD